MKTMLELMQEAQRERWCGDCEKCPFCDGRMPNYCPIDGHEMPETRMFMYQFVD